MHSEECISVHESLKAECHSLSLHMQAGLLEPSILQGQESWLLGEIYQ